MGVCYQTINDCEHLVQNKTENIVMDIVRITTSISDNEGFIEEHRLVVINLTNTNIKGLTLM